MSDIGAPEKTVFARNVNIYKQITPEEIKYAEAENIRMEWGYSLYEEEVLGSAIPVQGTGVFSGTINIESLYTTDEEFSSFITPDSDGQIPEKTLYIKEKDSQGTPTTKTWTVKARFNRVEHVARKGGFVRCNVSGVLTQPPTVT